MYFRVMLIGFFEGIGSERGIAWRVADSLCLRQFLRIGLDERPPDHVTISRTRRLLDEDTHQEVFGWVLRQVTRAGLLRGKTIGIDATTLEASAAMKSIVRRDTDESYTEYLSAPFVFLEAEKGSEGALRWVVKSTTLARLDQAAFGRLRPRSRAQQGRRLPRDDKDVFARGIYLYLRYRYSVSAERTNAYNADCEMGEQPGGADSEAGGGRGGGAGRRSRRD
jgi:hypothetical protein